MAVTLYYIVVPDGSAAPTGPQIVAGVDYGAVTVLDAGSVAYSGAGTYDADSAPVTGASASTPYDQWWVPYDGVTYGTPVSGEITTEAAASVTPTLIASTATFGSHTVARVSVAAIGAARIESTASFGAATVTRTALSTVSPARIASTATLYAPAVSADGLAAVSPLRIESTAVVPAPTVTRVSVQAISAPRIESAASFGAATITRSRVASITPGRIDSTAAFGVPVVSSSGVAQIVVPRIESTATFGTATAVRTGTGTADPAEVWAYVLGNGMTAEQTLLEVHAMLSAQGDAADIAAAVRAELAAELARIDELHQIHGLASGSPLVVGPASRTAAAISQTLAEAAGVVTVTRI